MADAFLEAAKDENVELIRQYIKAGFDVNYRSPTDGTTALYWASCVGSVAICKLLLDNGADVNAVCNQWGSRPIHAAADRGHTDCVFILISGGADVNLTCLGRHDTALHKAAFRGHYHVCQLLLDRGANTDVINVEGKTPIQEAHNGRHYDVYQLILTYEKGVQRLKKPATELIISDAKRSKAPSNMSAPLTALPQSRQDTSGATPSGQQTDDSGSSLSRLDDDRNSSRSGSAVRYYELAQKYKQMERYAEKLVTLLEKNQLKLAVANAKNDRLTSVEAELQATRKSLQQSNHKLEATEFRLEATEKSLQAMTSELQAARAELLATRNELARLQKLHRFSGYPNLSASYRARSVLADFMSDAPPPTPDRGDPLYSTFKRILERTDEQLVSTFSAELVRQANSGSSDSLPLLDVPWRSWRVGVDYQMDSDPELIRTSSGVGSSDQCTLLVRRGDFQYELKVYGSTENSEELQKRCHGYIKLPVHKNVKLPVHVFQLDEDSPPILSPGKVQCLVYPLTTTRLHDLLDLARRGDTAVTWSESFFRFLLYGLLSGLAYLHRHQVAHKPVTCRDIYLDRDLMPVMACLDPECTPDGAMKAYVEAATSESIPLPPEVENMRNTWSQNRDSDKETLMTQLSEKVEVFLLGHVIINVIFQWYRSSAQNPETGSSVNPAILESVSRDLRQLIVDMTRPNPEVRISAEIGKIRLGLLMFGPKPDDVQTMSSYQIWHQVELMKLLMNCQQDSCSDLDSSGEYTRTIRSSIRHNYVTLRRDFLTSVPLDKQWNVYRTLNTVKETET